MPTPTRFLDAYRNDSGQPFILHIKGPAGWTPVAHGSLDKLAQVDLARLADASFPAHWQPPAPPPPPPPPQAKPGASARAPGASGSSGFEDYVDVGADFTNPYRHQDASHHTPPPEHHDFWQDTHHDGSYYTHHE